MNEINGQMSPELMNFIQTLPKDKQDSTVYEIICEDRDGNIVERKFGVNTLTNLGFQTAYTDAGGWNTAYVIIGTGTGIPAPTDTDLFNRIRISPPAVPETIYAGTENAQRCLFDPDTGNIIGRRKTGQFVLDYNYDEIETNVNITEFGECGSHQTDINQLSGNIDVDRYGDWNNLHLTSHALVYDANHDPSYFVKRIDQKVTVSVFRAAVINISDLNRLWNDKKYLYMNPTYMVRSNNNNGENTGYLRYAYMMCGRCRAEDDFKLFPTVATSIHTDSPNHYELLNTYANAGFGRNNQCYTSYVELGRNYNTSYAPRPGEYRNNGTFAEFLLNDKYRVHGLETIIWNGLDTWRSRTYKNRQLAAFLLKPVNYETPEEISYDRAFVDDCLHPSFNNIFGLAHVLSYGQSSLLWLKNTLPVNDFHITSVKRYNYLTDDWDIDEQFVDDPDYDFRNPERALWGYYCNGNSDHPADIPREYDVMLNINQNVPIIGFNDSNTHRVFATDAYWDPTTFVEITNLKDVPQALQSKKYYIKTPTEYPYWEGGQATGFHTIREPNKHALVPSTPIVDLDLVLPLWDYGNRNGDQSVAKFYKCIYASDDGWIVCQNRLIYPESDDGTGHPYVYQLFTELNPYNDYDYRYIHYTDKHIIAPHNRRYMKPTDTTNARIIVVTPDPAHPDVDPMTTAVRYYDSDIMPIFGETAQIDAYLDGYIKMFSDPHEDRFFFARGNWGFDAGETTESHVVSIDLSSPTPSLNVLPNTTNLDTGHWGIIWGTDYIVWLGENTETEFVYYIYDTVSEQVIHQCHILKMSSTYSLRGVFGFKDMIYVQAYYDNESWYIHKYDYVQDTELEASNWLLGYIANEPTDYRIGANQYGMCIDYDDETFFYCSNNGDNSWDGRNAFAIFDTNLASPYFFSINSENRFIHNYAAGRPRIKKMNGGKDYVVIVYAHTATVDYNEDNYSNYSYTFPLVYNLGYIKNKGYNTPQLLCRNIPIPAFRIPPLGYYMGGQDTTSHAGGGGAYYFGEYTFYKNYLAIITNSADIKCKLTPIELVLPHRMTGTTKSIQSYMHPKKIGAHSCGLFVTNNLS